MENWYEYGSNGLVCWDGETVCTVNTELPDWESVSGVIAAAPETARKLAEAEARIAELESEIEFLKKDIEAIDISDHVLGCGIEDRNITNRYEAARYGFNVAYERAMECLPV